MGKPRWLLFAEECRGTAPGEVKYFVGSPDGLTNRALSLSQSVYLPYTLFSNPLESGHGIVGWVWFKLKGLPPHKMPLGTKYVIEFEDYEQKKVAVDWTFGGPQTDADAIFDQLSPK